GLRIAIATPSENAYSETFIAAHMQRLRDVELIMVDGSLPNRVVDGPLLLHRSGAGRIMDHAKARLARTTTQGLLRERIQRMLRQRGIQVVLAEYGNTGEAILESCQRAGVPLVVHFHGFDAHRTDQIERMGRYQRIFAHAAALVVVSRAMEAQLLALGAPRDKVIYNCYGIDVQRFAAGNPSQAPPHFVSVGRFVDKKAPHMLLGSFMAMAARVPDARLTMVGDGVLWESCVQRVRAAGLEGRVSLCGVKEQNEIAALMRGARAFVQHSVRALSGDSEGTPLAVLEAMASGLPVIATRHTGIGDVVVHEERGLLCDEFDVAAMAEHMERIAHDPDLAGRMGRAGRIHVEKDHRVEDSVARLQAILDRCARS
ncbi:MAG: glycosyltransferase, partial [Flavobacteriales bacterium]|nr:glycosyltransferase [Flavobacteriales bacterium]